MRGNLLASLCLHSESIRRHPTGWLSPPSKVSDAVYCCPAATENVTHIHGHRVLIAPLHGLRVRGAAKRK
jgi:hypothetical protein